MGVGRGKAGKCGQGSKRKGVTNERTGVHVLGSLSGEAMQGITVCKSVLYSIVQETCQVCGFVAKKYGVFQQGCGEGRVGARGKTENRQD